MVLAETITFSTIQSAMAKHFKAMSHHRLFATAADSSQLWDIYLASFPAGSNPIYKTRTEHDCSCCRHFIKTIGGVVNVDGGEVTTIWDFAVPGPFQTVVDAMQAYVRSHAIENVFLHPQRLVGTASSRQLLEDRSVKTWDHFHVNLPDSAVARGGEIGPKLSDFRATHDVMLRGLMELSMESIDTVLELIAQNSLYRGEEHRRMVVEFRKLKGQFSQVPPDRQDLFVWEHLDFTSTAVSRIRNTAIGTLLIDLSDGKDLEFAVRQFESKVAPTNYQRPTALVTKAMVARAQKTVEELGLTTALERRLATMDDIGIADLLFADRSTGVATTGPVTGASVFDTISASVAVDAKKLARVEEIPVSDFISKVLPTAQTLEVLLESRHAGNMVSLIAPVDPTARRLFKWDNGFSWTYTGDLADSIRERVKQAGGSVTGDFRASLAWFNLDDLDLHLEYPNRGHIWYANKRGHTGRGELDVDMNAYRGTTRTPVENITFPSREEMPEGEYRLYVQQFCQREASNVGFEVEMEFDGTVYRFAYPRTVKPTENVEVCVFNYSRQGGMSILRSLLAAQTSKVIWSLSTQTFHRVRAVMLSPNHWGGKEIGNRHWFFMLYGCRNDSTARGFFNEFLSPDLAPHRKVMEMAGARMRTEASDSQLSGVGFSSTKRDHVLCRVTGTFSRTVKVLF